MLRIIDNKRIDITDDEFKVYEELCASYDKPNFKGADLFKNLFESDKNGRIIFLKPPTSYTSMEVCMFMVNVMVHQHLRDACNVVYDVTEDARKTINEMKELIKKLNK